MSRKLFLFILGITASVIISCNSWADLGKYTYPYDISEIEWQFLNWTAAYRGTTMPAGPFTLEKIEYNRKERKINIYLKGRQEEATDENLKKSIRGISVFIQQRFVDFDEAQDLVAHYAFFSENGQKTGYLEYASGSFSGRELKIAPLKPQKTY